MKPFGKFFSKAVAMILTVAVAAMNVCISASAATDTNTDTEAVVYNGNVIATRRSDGTLIFINQNDAHKNGSALYYLINNDDKKRIILPAETIKIDRGLTIGSNTVIRAEGATIYQTEWQKQIFNNECDKLNYKSLENVTIQGGTWKIADNNKQKKSTSTFRFNHASNIKLRNCRVITNYKSHAVELIACKNVTVDGCTLVAKGTPISDSLEEALQIDIATKATAPTVAAFGSKYVAGQTCENITVKNSTISGSRGICCNKTDTENGKYLGKYHKNITISNCTVTGVTSEAVALHNTVGLTVKNNTIISKGSRLNTVYTIGLNIATFAKNSESTKYENRITGNTIKGGRQGLYIIAYGGNNFGRTVVKNNKLYSKKGKSSAKVIKNCKSLVDQGNKTYKW